MALDNRLKPGFSQGLQQCEPGLEWHGPQFPERNLFIALCFSRTIQSVEHSPATPSGMPLSLNLGECIGDLALSR